MKPIWTKNDELFGTLDENSYILYMKDGEDTRSVRVPPCGMTLEFIVGDGQPETIVIPPQDMAAK